MIDTPMQVLVADEIHFHMTVAAAAQMTWKEYEVLERALDGQPKMYQLRPILARFIVDVNDRPLKFEAAMEVLGSVTLEKITPVLTKFVESTKAAAVPNPSGSPSTPQPSAAAVGESPSGSASS